MLHLAVERKATLLAGDELLRKSAEERDVAVRGLLWVLDELVEKHTITPAKAAMALERLLKGKARLPVFDSRTGPCAAGARKTCRLTYSLTRSTRCS